MNWETEWKIEELRGKVKRYENIIGTIANIDTIFMNSDGTDRKWDDREALNRIEELVDPVWKEMCEESKRFK